MACNKNTCKTCKRTAQFLAFRKLLPTSIRSSFNEWYDDLFRDLENAEAELLTSKPEWKNQFKNEY